MATGSNSDLVQEAGLITRAVDSVLDNPATRTRHIGGTPGTTAFAEAVRANLIAVATPA